MKVIGAPGKGAACFAMGRAAFQRGGRVLLLGLAGLLAACGGGGGGGGDGWDYSVSANSASFSAEQGGSAPAPQAVTVTVTKGLVYIDTDQTGECFGHTFDITGERTATISIIPSSCATPGVHVGTITVTGCPTTTCQAGAANSRTYTIRVTYTVTPAPLMTSSVSAIEFNAQTAPAASLDRQLELALSGHSRNWTSSIEYTSPATGWLSLSAASGTTLPATITASGSTAGLQNGRHTANIVFRSGSVSRVTVPVTLSYFAPSVNFVSPYVGRTSVAGDVVIRGHGFSAVSAGAQVFFGATPASAVTVVNDTEIRARYPALAAGNYPVTVRNASVSLPTRARLLVAAGPGFGYAAIPSRARQAQYMVYDSERRALYVLDDFWDRRLDAYRFNGTGWAAAETVSFGNYGIGGFALTPDGSELLVILGGAQRMDPATLQPLGSYPAEPRNPIFTNDGFAFVSPTTYIDDPDFRSSSFDLLSGQISQLSPRIDLSKRTSMASGDGSKVFFFEYGLSGASRPVIVYNATDGSFTPIGLSTDLNTYPMAVDKVGSRFITATMSSQATIEARVYTGSGVLLGGLPEYPQLQGSYTISPDGRFAYVYERSSNRIRKFDLNAPNGGGFVEIGTGTVLPDAPCTSDPGVFARLIVSADGETLFLGGNLNILVVPAP